MGVESLAGFLQFLGSGESLYRGEGTARSKEKMDRVTRQANAAAHVCEKRGHLGPGEGGGICGIQTARGSGHLEASKPTMVRGVGWGGGGFKTEGGWEPGGVPSQTGAGGGGGGGGVGGQGCLCVNTNVELLLRILVTWRGRGRRGRERGRERAESLGSSGLKIERIKLRGEKKKKKKKPIPPT